MSFENQVIKIYIACLDTTFDQIAIAYSFLNILRSH